jgi:hypothetical protein
VAITWEALTVDAREPESLAAWWAQTLGWQTVRHPLGVEVQSPDGRGASLFFHGSTDTKSVKNRLHLDLYADDQPAAIEELLARRATRADIGQPADAADVVLRDPEGNEFCLLEPR